MLAKGPLSLKGPPLHTYITASYLTRREGALQLKNEGTGKNALISHRHPPAYSPMRSGHLPPNKKANFYEHAFVFARWIDLQDLSLCERWYRRLLSLSAIFLI